MKIRGPWLEFTLQGYEECEYFQDAEGTIPCTKDGDPVGCIKPKAGPALVATRPEDRPTYRTGRPFDIEIPRTDE